MNATEHHVIPMQIVKIFLEILIVFVFLVLLEMEQIVSVSLKPKEDKSYFIVNKKHGRHDSIFLIVITLHFLKLNFRYQRMR